MSPRANDKVAMEAREWFVRLLDDEISAADIARWQGWIARSPAHRDAYDRVTLAWSLGGAAAVGRPSIGELADDAYDGSAPVSGWRGRPSRRAAPALIAASLAVAVLGGAVTLGMTLQGSEAQAITTARAEHKQAALADGSTVAVGAMTGVQVRLGEQRREIKLDRGEAFFTVAHDARRPFVVQTPFGAVTAVGTAFNVDVGKDQLCLNVTEGEVIVHPFTPGLPPGLRGLLSKPVRVSAGQRLVVDASGAAVSTVIAAATSPVTWPEGRLEYRGEPLRSVVEDVNRYAEHPVVLRDPAVGELAYTGTVRLDATADWAVGLPAAFPLDVSKGQGGVIVLSTRM